ncbi:MAG: hypothetical protein IID40_09485, partial [Planctomycetes bacterium]|nr:hypothetical protein [Planctomycetota bacterium]
AEDVVADGVRLLMSRQQLRGDTQQGIDQFDAGKGVDGKQVFAGLSQQVQIGIEQADRGEMIDHDTVFGQLKAMAADAQSSGDE